jgi:indole-3-glycerol phosphate synthase / phosphoribosylanthranilate isomerase
MAETINILGEIVERKRRDVAARLGSRSLDELRASAAPTSLSLRSALARPGTRFIFEVKRASPSQGPLRGIMDLAALARAYRGAADAVSVLTDTPYFHGTLADLGEIRRHFDGPLLAKDFIVDPRQVPEARAHGADAVLAMLSVLKPTEVAEILAEADRLGMDVIVEVHDRRELNEALRLRAPIIGINNRNLKTLEVDLSVTERLAPLIPADRIVIAESGIVDRSDVARLAPHADAFLVGTSLMRASNPGQKARELAFGRAKVCGLTSVDDARLAMRGASHSGMIFVGSSPRAITIGQAVPIADAARESGMATVGVFRNARVMETARTAEALGLDVVQLHGEEDRGYISSLRNLLSESVEIWAVSAVGRNAPSHRSGADRTVFDTEQGGRCGGTGQVFDWTRLRQVESLHSGILAGGLSPLNAAAAAKLGAFALDVSSGVETAPGRKDPAKLEAFFEALRLPSRGESARCA